jgi:type I restriction enzyme R subunit
MLFVDVKSSTNLITRERKTSTNVIFPRFHQWQAVSRMVEQVQAENAGGRFLIQHSAGSGKTNTIGWTAHHLSNLHDQAGRKIFDTVVVITDRTVLDDQMQRAVLQIEGKRDYVYNVDRRARTDAGSKSRALLKALQDRRRIVVVTIQTFPAVLRLLSEDDSLAGHRFAVIADEAHSSQAGATARIRSTPSQTFRRRTCHSSRSPPPRSRRRSSCSGAERLPMPSPPRSTFTR